MTTLVEMYRHVGERFRVDVSKKEMNATKYDIIVTQHFLLQFLSPCRTSASVLFCLSVVFHCVVAYYGHFLALLVYVAMCSVFFLFVVK